MQNSNKFSDQDRESVRKFMQLLVQHERSLYAHILSQVPNWSDADEIAQETRLRLWEQFDQFEPGSNFGAWAKTVARYQVLTYRRQKQRKGVRFSDTAIELLAAESGVRSDDLCPRHLALEQCLAELTDSHKELIVQSYSGRKQSIRQVARQIGRSYEATRKMLLRIRGMLAECVDRRLKLEGQS